MRVIPLPVLPRSHERPAAVLADTGIERGRHDRPSSRASNRRKNGDRGSQTDGSSGDTANADSSGSRCFTVP